MSDNLLKPEEGEFPDLGHPSVEGSVLILPLNEGADPATGAGIHDQSGHRNHGTTWTSGLYGPALSFSGSDKVLVPSRTFSQFTFIVTFTTNVNNWAIVLGKDAGGFSSFFAARSGTADGRVVSEEGNIIVASGGLTIETGVTYTHAVTWDGVTGNYYVDGKLVRSQVPGFPGDTFVVDSLGNGFAASFFDGTLSDVKAYPRVLSASEIKQQFDFPWQAWQRDNLLFASQVTPVTGGVNLLTGLLQQPSKLIA